MKKDFTIGSFRVNFEKPLNKNVSNPKSSDSGLIGLSMSGFAFGNPFILLHLNPGYPDLSELYPDFI